MTFICCFCFNQSTRCCKFIWLGRNCVKRHQRARTRFAVNVEIDIKFVHISINHLLCRLENLYVAVNSEIQTDITAAVIISTSLSLPVILDSTLYQSFFDNSHRFFRVQNFGGSDINWLISGFKKVSPTGLRGADQSHQHNQCKRQQITGKTKHDAKRFSANFSQTDDRQLTEYLYSIRAQVIYKCFGCIKQIYGKTTNLG